MIWNKFTSSKKMGPVEIGDEEGFVDLTFKGIEIIKKDDFSCEFKACGMLEDKEVGFSIEILPGWKPQEMSGIDQPFHWGGC